MRHFGYLSAAQVAALFERPPERFDRGSGTDLLSVALGATLYMPADRPVAGRRHHQAGGGRGHLGRRLPGGRDRRRAGRRRPRTTWSTAFTALHGGRRTAELPLLFVRVREAAQIPALVRRLGQAARLLDGIVLPKFTALQRHRVPAHAGGGRAGGGRLAAGDAGDRVRRRALRRDPGRRAHPPARAAAPRPAAHPRGPHRRHRPVRALRAAALPGAVHLRHQGRRRR